MKSIFDYTLRSVTRFGMKNLAVSLIFAVLVWLLSSAMMVTHSLSHEVQAMITSLPEILVQKKVADRQVEMEEDFLDEISSIPGVQSVQGRVWGQYYFALDNIYVSLMGMDLYAEPYKKSLQTLYDKVEGDEEGSIYLSLELKNLLQKYMMQGVLYFNKADGDFYKAKVGGYFKADTDMEARDLVLIPIDEARGVLGVEEGLYTDMIVRVPNPEEIDNIALKITHIDNTLHVVTKETMIKEFQMLYDYKSGWFLSMLLICFVTFSIILYDKASGLRSEEKQEIGILKALGWEIEHIIQHKLTEALILSLGAFVLGVTLALGYVFILEAPVLKSLFMGDSLLKQPFDLPFVVNVQLFALLFFATVPLYIAASIIPSWRAAVEDAGEVMR